MSPLFNARQIHRSLPGDDTDVDFCRTNIFLAHHLRDIIQNCYGKYPSWLEYPLAITHPINAILRNVSVQQKGVENGVEFISTMSYLGAMVIQIYQFCFIGNEITYSVRLTFKSARHGVEFYDLFQSNKLSENAFISDVQSFDGPTKQIFLIMMGQLQREINISAGGMFKIKLNIDTFLKVLLPYPSFGYNTNCVRFRYRS